MLTVDLDHEGGAQEPGRSRQVSRRIRLEIRGRADGQLDRHNVDSRIRLGRRGTEGEGRQDLDTHCEACAPRAYDSVAIGLDMLDVMQFSRR